MGLNHSWMEVTALDRMG